MVLEEVGEAVVNLVGEGKSNEHSQGTAKHRGSVHDSLTTVEGSNLTGDIGEPKNLSLTSGHSRSLALTHLLETTLNVFEYPLRVPQVKF